MKLFACVALGAASLVAAIAPANADIVTVTYSGKVSDGIDVDGFFGAAGASLKKQNYTLTFTTDTSGFDTSSTDDYSEASYCCTVTAVMTIGQSSYTINGTYSTDPTVTDSNITQWLYPDYSFGYQLNSWANATNGDFALGEVGSDGDFFSGLGLTALSYTVSNDDAYTGEFSAASTYLDLRISTVSVNVTASPAPTPAPEPASWALMVGGFGLVGAAMRSRSRVRFA